jgi:hypothetical protein
MVALNAPFFKLDEKLLEFELAFVPQHNHGLDLQNFLHKLDHRFRILGCLGYPGRNFEVCWTSLALVSVHRRIVIVDDHNAYLSIGREHLLACLMIYVVLRLEDVSLRCLLNERFT